MNNPLLRYFGGKFKMSSQIIELFPPHGIYVDVFGGSASILLQKHRSSKEVYNDLNREVFIFFKVLRENPDQLQHLLKMTPYCKLEYEAAHEPQHTEMEIARTFFIRSWMGVGGAGIKHRSGFRKSYRQDIVPEWNYQSAIDLIPQAVERLRGVVFENLDFLQIIKDYDGPQTLFYLDPPYLAETRTGNQKYKHEFTPADHTAMLQLVTQAKGNFVISGYKSQLYEQYLGAWNQKKVESPTSGQNTRTEIIWYKNSTLTLFP